MRWTEASWLAEATTWIHEHATVAGELEQLHVRRWSTVIRVPTSAGDLWFKAVSPFHRFEPALTALLAELRSDRVPEIVALDRDRAWMLLRDGGTRLRELPPTIEDWTRVLPLYAELQIAAAPHAAELLDLGVPDYRLAKLRDLLDDLLAGPLPGLTSEEQRTMVGRLPEVEETADRLIAHGMPETIQHDDLHDGQVFVKDGAYRILDWGDACFSHPFHSLTVTLRAATWRFGLEPGGPDVLRLRDAYLEPFGPPSELAPVADDAYRTGTLARTYAWHRYVAAGQAEDEEDAEAAAYGIKLFLEGGPLGTWE